ncbi:MAG: hypothetical protein KKA61_04600 [Nanoarchaeota archaeon]|nr:hypothetical protein [Nanoarchaeota archaeon]
MFSMDRQDLDNLTTKQDFCRPQKLTEKQETKLLEATIFEREQFKDKKPLTKDDIPNLAKVESSEHIYLAKTVENPCLTHEMKAILDEIESKFSKENPEGFFIIVSMTRIGAEQMKANPKIADKGTHPKGEAIDFAAKFMNKYFPDSAKVLKQILIEMQNQGKINFLNEEDSTSFWHVSRRLK